MERGKRFGTTLGRSMMMMMSGVKKRTQLRSMYVRRQVDGVSCSSSARSGLIYFRVCFLLAYYANRRIRVQRGERGHPAISVGESESGTVIQCYGMDGKKCAQ